MEQSTPAAPSLHEPTRASALIFNDAGEYLLHLRDQRPDIVEPGTWSLLGGSRELHDTTLTATIQRELHEEVNLSLPHIEPFSLVHTTGHQGEGLAIQIFAARWNGDAAALHLNEGVMLHWFRPQDMHRLRIAPTTLDVVHRHAATRRTQRTVTAARRRESGTIQQIRPKPPVTANGAALNVIGVHLYAEDEEGRVLLGLRHPGSTFAGNSWHFLAGHCEQESAVQCLVREAHEEAGLTIDPDDVELVHAVHLVDEPGGQPRLGLFFRARRWEGTPEVREPDRCVSWGWWSPDGLPDRTVPYARAAIDGIQTGCLYTEMGWSLSPQPAGR